MADVRRVFVDMLDVTENETISCVVAVDGTHALVPWKRWHDLRLAFNDCLRYVDVDNLTMQHKYRCWLDVLDRGLPFDPSNVEVET